jgi:hypothetical protein
MTQLFDVLARMNPAEIDKLADELQALRSSDPREWPIEAESLRLARQLAASALEHWEAIRAMSNLHSGGYSPAGTASPISHLSGVIRG